ncbi:DUF6192 family protein [Amycolatopsis sp. NPDC059657]|uniref:DUF6192 family protein n=1 Tax=Amycolatopsis sp. NPDC059657 TaxID=3346899 RepID=UPI00366CB2BE
MKRPEGFTQREWETFVTRGREIVRRHTACQFALGDLLLEKLPYSASNGDGHVRRALDLYADQVGLAARTLMVYRQVSRDWPVEKRNLDESWTVHDIFSAQPEQWRFKKINNPPVGASHWTVDQAREATSRKARNPSTVNERVERVEALLSSDDDAASVVTAVLKRRPEVAKKVVGDTATRSTLHRAEMTHYDERRQERQAPVARSPKPAQRPRPTETQREVLELLGICTAFYTQMQRVVPRLRVADYDNKAKVAVLDSIARVRAAADWCETVISTGDTSMDEALAKILEGEE